MPGRAPRSTCPSRGARAALWCSPMAAHGRRNFLVIAGVALAALAATAASRVAREHPAASPAALPAERAASVIAKGPYLQALGVSGVTIELELGAAAAAPPSRCSRRAARARTAARSPGARAGRRAPSTRCASTGSRRRPPTSTASRRAARPRVAGHFTTAPADGAALPLPRLRRQPLQRRGARRRGPRHGGHALRFPRQHRRHGARWATDPDDWAELFSIEGHLLRDRCVFAAVGNHELARGDRAGEVAFLRYFAGAEEGHELDAPLRELPLVQHALLRPQRDGHLDRRRARLAARRARPRPRRAGPRPPHRGDALGALLQRRRTAATRRWRAAGVDRHDARSQGRPGPRRPRSHLRARRRPAGSST